ncbi:hypothetical protein V1524DRAFT_57325 [Lipomyces starkeyi]
MKDADKMNASRRRRCVSEDLERRNDSDDDEDDEADDDSLSAEVLPEQLIKNKKLSLVFSSLIRSKGYIWLANRALQTGEWSQAGAMLTIQGGAPWFYVLDDAVWPEDPDVVANIKADFEGKWGDRRQELVFIGEHIDPKRISGEFDQCLLTDNEMAKWRRVMSNTRYDALTKEDKLCELLEDGFEAWPLLDPDDRYAEEVEEVEEVEEDAMPNTIEGIIASNASLSRQQLRNSKSSSKDDGHRHLGHAHAHRHGAGRSTAARA